MVSKNLSQLLAGSKSAPQAEKEQVNASSQGKPTAPQPAEVKKPSKLGGLFSKGKPQESKQDAKSTGQQVDPSNNGRDGLTLTDKRSGETQPENSVASLPDKEGSRETPGTSKQVSGHGLDKSGAASSIPPAAESSGEGEGVIPNEQESAPEELAPISADDLQHPEQPAKLSQKEVGSIEENLEILRSSIKQPDLALSAVSHLARVLRDTPQYMELLHDEDVGLMVKALRTHRANIVTEKQDNKEKKKTSNKKIDQTVNELAEMGFSEI